MKKLILAAVLFSGLNFVHAQATFFRTNIFIHHAFNKTLPNFKKGHFVLGNTNDSLACSSKGILFETDSSWKIVWSNTFTEGGIGNVANDFVVAGSHSLLVTGTTFTSNCNQSTWYVNRFDSSGKVLWSKTFGNINVSENGVRILSIDTSAFMVMGNRNDTLDSCFVMKMDINGNILWMRSFANSLGSDMVKISNSKFEVVGTTSTSIQNGFAFAIDTSGKVIWGNRFTNGQNAGFVAASGNAAGQTLLGGFYGATAPTYAPLVLLIDSNGVLIDENTIHATSKDTLTLTTVASDGGSRWLIGFDRNHSFADILILNSALQTLHQSLLATKGGVAFIQPKTGGYYVGGSINGSNTTPFLAQTDTAGFVGCDDSLVVDTIQHISFFSAADDSLRTVSVAISAISVSTENSYDLEAVCEHSCWIQPIITRTNDTLTCSPSGLTYQWLDENLQPISGATNQIFVPSSFGKYYVSVVTPNSCSGTSWVFDFQMETGITELNRISVMAYPNPFSFSFDIQLDNSQKSIVNFYSMQGQLLSRTETSGLLHLDESKVVPGAYLLQVIQEDGLRGTAIVIKQ